MNRAIAYLSWLLPLTLFIVHQFTQRTLNLSVPWADSYLDPFCAGVLGLHGVALERKLYFGQPQLTLVDMLTTLGVIVVISEGVFPYLSDRFVADRWDVVAIALGFGWYVVTARWLPS